MARGYGVLASGALALVAAGIGACVDDGVSMHVICPIKPELEGNVCTFDPGSEICVLQGVMNLATTLQYNQSLRVQSGLASRAREVPVQSESNGMQVRSARVELRDTTGRRLPLAGAQNPYTTLASGYIPPGSFGSVLVNMITPQQGLALTTGTDPEPSTPLLSQIVVAVTLKGKTDGDVEVESGEYLWPIKLISVNGARGGNVCDPSGFCESSVGQDEFARNCTSL